MKKEKRELTLKQLETCSKIVSKVFKVVAILFLVVAAITLIIIPMDLADAEDVIFLVFISVETFLFIAIMIILKIWEIIRERINSRKKQMKVKVLKRLAKEHGGHIKAFVTVKDEEVIKDILSRGIVKIVIDDMEGPNLVTNIQLTDTTWQTGVYISSEKLISILDEESKKEMFDHLVKYIKIGNVEGKTTEVTINSSDFLCTKQQTTDDELLQIFELKE